jgi:DNA replication protein DnaC
VHKCKDFKERCDHCYKEYLTQIRKVKIQKLIPPKFTEIEWLYPNIKKEFEKYKVKPISMFIWGKSGRSKTVFITALAKEWIMQGLQVDFISYPAFIMDLQDSFHDSEASAYKMAKKKAIFEGILLIDDLGVEKPTAFVEQVTYYIINEREQRKLITVFTSNFSLQEIDEQRDSRISSRIGGMCKVLNFQGPDRRVNR